MHLSIEFPRLPQYHCPFGIYDCFDDVLLIYYIRLSEICEKIFHLSRCLLHLETSCEVNSRVGSQNGSNLPSIINEVRQIRVISYNNIISQI